MQMHVPALHSRKPNPGPILASTYLARAKRSYEPVWLLMPMAGSGCLVGGRKLRCGAGGWASVYI